MSRDMPLGTKVNASRRRFIGTTAAAFGGLMVGFPIHHPHAAGGAAPASAATTPEPVKPAPKKSAPEPGKPEETELE